MIVGWNGRESKRKNMRKIEKETEGERRGRRKVIECTYMDVCVVFSYVACDA